MGWGGDCGFLPILRVHCHLPKSTGEVKGRIPSSSFESGELFFYPGQGVGVFVVEGVELPVIYAEVQGSIPFFTRTIGTAQGLELSLMTLLSNMFWSNPLNSG